MAITFDGAPLHAWPRHGYGIVSIFMSVGAETENAMTRLSSINDQTIIPQSLNLGEPTSAKTQFPKRSKVNHEATASIAQPTLNAFNVVLLLIIVIVLVIVVAIAVATAVIVICCVFQVNNAGANRSQNKNASAAQATLRIDPSIKRIKIWDHPAARRGGIGASKFGPPCASIKRR